MRARFWDGSRSARPRGRPIGVAVVGGGVFASLYLAQALRTPGIHVVGVADLAPERVRERLLGGLAGAALRRRGRRWRRHDLAHRRRPRR